jgi:anti-sigma factor RsiW
MSCAWTQARLSPWLEGDLDAGSRRSIDGHLEACADCRGELAVLRGTVQQLHSLRACDTSPHLAQRVAAAVRDAERPASSRTPLGIALRLSAHLALAGGVAALAVVASHRLAERGAPDLVAELVAAQSTASGRVGPGERVGASEPPAEPTPAEIDATLDKALVDAGVLVRGLRGQSEQARELWLRSVVERARARGDAGVLAAALRTREEAEAAALAERLAARP